MKSRVRQYLLTGLLAWLPVGVTLWVLNWLYGLLDGIFGSVLGAAEAVFPGLHLLVSTLRGVPGLGVIMVLLVVIATGVLAANIAGQWWMRQWNTLITRIPVVRSIYTSVKQVSDTWFSGSGQACSKALLVRYPHADSWTIAFLTGKPSGQVGAQFPEPMVSVYVPTTPNPTSGFFLMMRQRDVVELDMSVDDALKYIISMGVVAPPPAAAKPLAAPETLPKKD